MSRTISVALAVLFAAAIGGCVVHGHAGTRAAPPPPTVVEAPTTNQPPPPTVVSGPTTNQPPPPTVVDRPVSAPTQTGVTPPSVARPQGLGIPQCSQEGSTGQCPSGTVCAIDTDQALGCRKICQRDSDCDAGQRCVPSARVNRSVCLGP